MSDRIGDHRYAYFAYAAIITISAPRAPPPPLRLFVFLISPPPSNYYFRSEKKTGGVAFFFFFFSRTFQLGLCLLLIGRGESWCFFFSRGNEFRFFIFAYLCARDIDSTSFFFFFLYFYKIKILLFELGFLFVILSLLPRFSSLLVFSFLFFFSLFLFRFPNNTAGASLIIFLDSLERWYSNSNLNNPFSKKKKKVIICCLINKDNSN